MGNFAPVYTEQQRRAVGGAMLGDLGEPMSARHAVEAAAAGDLGIPPFVMPMKSAYSIRDREQARREPQDADPGAQPPTAIRAQALINREICSLEQEERAGKRPNLERLRQVIRAQRELDQAPRTRSVSAPTHEEEPNGLVARLAAGREGPEDESVERGEAAPPNDSTSTARGERPFRLHGHEVASPAHVRETASITT